MRIFSAILLLFLSVSTAFAATEYTYTGSNYQNVFGSYTTAMSLTGHFTTAQPLPPNMPLTDIGPTGSNLVQSWSFNDGLFVFNNTNSMALFGGAGTSFQVSTDANGHIADFAIRQMSPLPPNHINQLMHFFVLTGLASNPTLQTVLVYYDGVCNAVDANNVCTNATQGNSHVLDYNVVAGVWTSKNLYSSIPTLSTWGIILLTALLAMIGLYGVRRSTAHAGNHA